MACEHRFILPLANGLHARPASLIETLLRGYSCAVTFVNERSGARANAKSVLALIATDSRKGDPCRFAFEGGDELVALSVLSSFVQEKLAASEQAAVAVTVREGAPVLPRSLAAAGRCRILKGIPASQGIGRGPLVFFKGFSWQRLAGVDRGRDPSQEHQRLLRAMDALRLSQELASRRASGAELQLIQAHLSLLRDPVFAEQTAAGLRAGRSAEQAVVAATEANTEMLRRSGNPYLRERALDLEDLARGLLERLCGPVRGTAAPFAAQEGVLVAESLSPGQLMALDRSRLRGLVLGHVGLSSHTVILARSFGIPTLVGVELAGARLSPGEELVVDACLGLAVAGADAGVLAWYQRQQDKLGRLRARLLESASGPGRTRDGRSVEVAVNLSGAAEARPAFAQGADAVGLFRTEFLFMAPGGAPGEEAQLAVYEEVVRAAAGRAVILRSLDAGGDKPVPCVDFPPEKNPFLGYRGVRLYGDHEGLLRTQFRAMLRAAALGPVKVMAPMVGSLEEARLARRLFEEAAAELASEGLAHGISVPFGLMIEVPSAVFVLRELAEVAEFFSIGTNDLSQYFLAVDRENSRLSGLCSTRHPGFIRLLVQLVREARAAGRWIGLCGEMGEDAKALPLLVGLGLDELSLSPSRVSATKAALARLDAARCQAFLERALACRTRAEVEDLLAEGIQDPEPLLEPDLILSDVECGSKAGALRMLADLLHLQGRCQEPEVLEEELWQREDTYSTGLGEGLAVPHCRSTVLSANTIAILRCPKGVDWGAADGEPVRLVILLAIRSQDHGKEHLKLLARLSRLMMREEFRDRLNTEQDKEILSIYVRAALQG